LDRKTELVPLTKSNATAWMTMAQYYARLARNDEDANTLQRMMVRSMGRIYSDVLEHYQTAAPSIDQVLRYVSTIYVQMDRTHARAELSRLVKDRQETYVDVATRALRVARRAFESEEEAVVEARRRLPDGMRRHLELTVNVKTADQFMDEALRYQAAEGYGSSVRQMHVMQAEEWNEEEERDALAVVRSRPTAPWAGRRDCCFKCGETTHRAGSCPEQYPVCYNCRKGGHTTARCQVAHNPVPKAASLKLDSSQTAALATSSQVRHPSWEQPANARLIEHIAKMMDEKLAAFKVALGVHQIETDLPPIQSETEPTNEEVAEAQRQAERDCLVASFQ
jgi:hypothetical protein